MGCIPRVSNQVETMGSKKFVKNDCENERNVINNVLIPGIYKTYLEHGDVILSNIHKKNFTLETEDTKKWENIMLIFMKKITIFHLPYQSEGQYPNWGQQCWFGPNGETE